MSYSYYLMHGLCLKAIFLVIGKLLSGPIFGPGLYGLLLPVCFVVTLLPSFILFVLVERPYSLAKK